MARQELRHGKQEIARLEEELAKAMDRARQGQDDGSRSLLDQLEAAESEVRLKDSLLDRATATATDLQAQLNLRQAEAERAASLRPRRPRNFRIGPRLRAV